MYTNAWHLPHRWSGPLGGARAAGGSKQTACGFFARIALFEPEFENCGDQGEVITSREKIPSSVALAASHRGSRNETWNVRTPRDAGCLDHSAASITPSSPEFPSHDRY